MRTSISKFHLFGLTILTLVLAACTTEPTGSPSGGRGTQAAAGSARVEVMLSEFAIEPKALSVPAATPLEITVMNHGQVHGRGGRRVPARSGGALSGRHARRRARTALRHPRAGGRPGDLGVPLPHPPPRRRAARMFGMVTALVVG